MSGGDFQVTEIVPRPPPASRALAYNLGNVLRTLATPEPIREWSLTSLKEKLIKIGDGNDVPGALRPGIVGFGSQDSGCRRSGVAKNRSMRQPRP